MRKRVSNIIFIVLVLILVILLFQVDIQKTTYSQQGMSNMNFGDITLDNTLVQEMIVPVDARIDNIMVKLATYARTNTNTNQIELFVNDELLYTRQFASETVQDDLYNNMFEEDLNLNLVAGDKVTIILTSEDGSVGNAITAWGYNTEGKGTLYTRDSEGNLTQIDGTMNLRLCYDTNFIGDWVNKYQTHPAILCFIIFMIVLGIAVFVKLGMELSVDILTNKENPTGV